MPKITDDDDIDLDAIDTVEHAEDDAPADQPEQLDEPEADEPDDPDAAEGDEPDDEPGPDEIAAQQVDRRNGRENARIRALNEQLRAEREERLSLQRRFDDFATRGAQPPQQRESAAERNARRAVMSETERLSEDMQEMREMFTQTARQTQMSVSDATDKSAFQASAATNARRQRLMPAVEAELARIRQQGGNVPREAVYFYLLGQKVDKVDAASVAKAKAKGARRLASQTVKPGSNRNDAAGTRGRGGKSLEERLANVQL